MIIDVSLVNRFKEIVGPEFVHTDPVELQCYAFDATFEEWRPDIVVRPGTTEEVSRVLSICNDAGVPVITRGMGSGLAGGTIPSKEGGLVLSLTRMNRVLEIDELNFTATVEAGVITADFQTEVEKLGLCYPPDPSSIKQSTLGGNAACNAGGPRCLKYGVTSDYVMGLKVVLADGRVMNTGGKAIKQVAGYNLTQLFVGSEGTLGVITELILKLIPKPKAAHTAKAVFPRLAHAGECVNNILNAGITPATIELMDEMTIATIEEAMHLGLPLDAEALLIIEADGMDEESVAKEIGTIADICRITGASDVEVARDEIERERLWQARRSIGPSLARRRPNKLGEDISLPRSAIPEGIKRIKEISEKYDLPIAIFGHAGDGNLHPNILFDRRDKEEWERVEQATVEIFATAIELGGTISGEHGVGTLKRPYLEQDIGPAAIDTMRGIKKALDPQDILNPGKILP